MAELKQLHRGRSDRPAIVFMHGLGGDWIDTWRHAQASAGDMWLHWVGQDCQCDVWTLQYDAAISAWVAQAMPITDQGDQVSDLLATEPGLKGKRLILVGHSMGGLVIKALLVQARTKSDQRIRAFVQQVAALGFVATPHNGSQLAGVAQALSGTLRINPQMDQMRAHDPTLRQLNQQFRNVNSEMSLQVRVFAETQDVTLSRRFCGIPLRTVGVRVVDPSSSDPGLEGVTAIPMAGDHFSICKPRGRQEHIHKSLCDFIAGVVEVVQRSGVAPVDLHLPPQLTAASAQVDVSRLTATRESAVLIGPHDVRLQPADGRFFGRDVEVAQLLAFLSGSADALMVTAKEISGVGGIGKTEVCKAALKVWLGKRPDEVVYFLSLPDGAGVGELLGRLASGVGLAQVESAEQVVATLPNGLYYLDNLESVAALDAGRALLRAMRSRQGIRLLVSSRLSLPSVFGPSVEIGVLPRNAALRLFREAWLGRDTLAADAELEKFVVGELGAHALIAPAL